MSETGDRLDHLRIPYDKIKFGKKLESQGYGTVFEGEFEDQRVALKQLNITNLANIKPKLLAEILTISKFRKHPNLVALLGFCDEKSNEITLVYEYVASGNLDDTMRKRLTTIQRFEICLGAARGLCYLHTGVESTTIVHGNIKLSKILLNSDAGSTKFTAKVSSFGLSKIVPGKGQKVLESSDEDTEKPTEKSDVYSFGVLLLIVLCGVSELVDTDDYQEHHVSVVVPKKMKQNKLRNTVHRDIRKEIKTEALETYAAIACQCVMENPNERPDMVKVVEELEKALRLQGGEVTSVQIPDSGNMAGAIDEAGKEPETDNIPASEEDVKDLLTGVNVDDASEKNTVEATNMESEPDKNHNEDAKYENSNKESKIIEENKEDDKSMNITTTPESSKGDTSTSTSQEVHESNILKSDRGSFSEVNDELERLRIPFEEIKFGQKIDFRGYGTMFEGEYNHQQVALKRLNITNLHNIKPKLLSAILTIYRFRQHPNLVALIGFCDESNKELILVYEYVSGGNLADKMSKHLNTIQRHQICLGAARGLEYLHSGDESVNSNPCIIHGNLKLSKILLNYDSVSSTFEAKVLGFGLPKLLPGHVEIVPKSTEKLTKESDVYTFGVLLLEVLCGVPELVDTDDYQERHVAELVPKRLEQNMLRKIVHFDIRDEITTESLETYARIACRCVRENPEERPTMSEVVVELEKALRLQGGKVSDVQIFGSSNDDVVPEVAVDKDDHKGDDNGETTSITEREPNGIEEAIDDINMVEKSFSVPVSGSNDVETVLEDAETKNGDNIHDPESTEEITINLNSNEEELNIIGENEVDNESKITTSSSKSDNGDDINPAMGEKVSDVQLLASSNGNSLNDADNEMSTIDQETTKENIDDFDSNNESKIIKGNKEDDKSLKITTPESSIGDTSTSTSQEVHESKILKSARGSFSEVNGDELERLRISFDEIKFGQKIDVLGYGTMFEGEYNHQKVALKRLNITNLHNIKPKLLSAILTIYRFRQHPNLVALIGFCDENNKELILVYEYVSGGNLADKMSKHLTTIQRHQICLGVARGLEYLHSGDESINSNPCIIHGNLKLSKILLNYDSVSSTFVAKVSGFGLPKLLPGHVEIGPKSAGKLTKESDVYAFGVLLLEVLCGVPEFVDTDDYQERHVTELVPKRLEQNLLRKIVHFDIRDEITTESLETYAKIACRCVRKNPEERPTMPEVVIELEKALRLQGGKVSDVHIFGSSNANVVPEVPVGEDDHEGDDNDEMLSSNITEEERKLEETFPVPVSGSNDVESVQEDAETKNGDNLNDPESKEETTVDQKSIEESKISVENEVSNVNQITTESSKSNNVDNCNSAMEDAEKENVTVPDSTEEILVDLKSNEESKIIGENEVNNEIKTTTSSSNSAMEVKNSEILDGNGKVGSLNTEKPELIVNDIGGDYNNSAIQIQESETKRSNSTCSESSNGGDITPSDYLLPQSPDKIKKTTRGLGNCCYCFCSCSWLQFISDRVVFYGGLFWNKLVSSFTWMTGQCSSKRD